MNALPSPSCGYLRARAMRQAPGLRSLISVVRGQARAVPMVRIAIAQGPARAGTARPGDSRVSPLPLGCRARSQWRRGAVRYASIAISLPGGSCQVRFGSRRLPLAFVSLASPTRRPLRAAGFPDFQPQRLAPLPAGLGDFRTGFPLRPKPSRSPSGPAGCVASCARFQSRCTGG